jgi:hypothetical protein
MLKEEKIPPHRTVILFLSTQEQYSTLKIRTKVTKKYVVLPIQISSSIPNLIIFLKIIRKLKYY